MAKIHLKISVDPLCGGEDVQAFCGEIVKEAEAMVFDDLELDATFMICRKCFSHFVESESGKKYFYFISSGQGALDAQRGRE